MKKRIWSILLALCMVLSLLPFGALAVNAAEVSDLRYHIENNEVMITSCRKEATGALTIPATIEGYPVTSIGMWAFDGCSNLTSLTIPDSVTIIDSGAFLGCTGLTSVVIPAGVTDFAANSAFIDCISLMSVEVNPGNPSIRSIDGVVFSKDAKTIICYPHGRSGTYQIPQGVTSVDKYAFCDSTGLTSVTIPDSTTSIGDSAFRGCSSLTSVRIPHSVSSIGIDAFHACKDLRAIQVEESNPSYSSVDGVLFSKDQKTLIKCPGGKTGAFVIPDSVTVIESAAFSICTGLTDVKIPSGVTEIYTNTFYGCTGLTSITIPDGVTDIDWHAFCWCENLKEVKLPASLTLLSCGAGGAFQGAGVTDVWYAGTEEQWAALIRDNADPFDGMATIHYKAHTHGLTAVAAVAPTCTKDGAAAYWKCEGCGRLFSDAAGTNEITSPAVVPALGHTWGAWSVTKPATETAEGVETRTCSVCGETETRAIPPLSHTHELTAVAAVAPTCTKDGTAAYWKCEGCGKLFSDAAGKNEITAPAVVPATGHKWDSGKVTKQPTETAEGVKTFTCTVCGETRTEAIPKLTPKPAENPFTDVPENQYYYEPVLWAVNHDPQITNGTGDGKFSPNDTCIRGQIVTFLWRAKGCPEPKSTVNPFSDVFPSDYYYKAVLWANENDITNGTGGGKFSPNDGCTRDQVVTFLWRTEGKPKVEAVNPFVDVPAGQYYTDAVLWAVSRNITNGTDATHFSPQKTCTRGEIVTFLYRDLA